MPTYEYCCAKCEHITNISASISEKEKGLKVSCSKCGSKKMQQYFGSVTVMVAPRGSKASKPAVPAVRPRYRCGCGCGH